MNPYREEVLAMRFPSIEDVARELRSISANVEGVCDVRLQVYPDGKWGVHFGLSDYDQDHHGYWGASCVPGVNAKGCETRFDSKAIARDLLNQAREHHADAGTPQFSLADCVNWTTNTQGDCGGRIMHKRGKVICETCLNRGKR
jgi:hypothetical protein